MKYTLEITCTEPNPEYEPPKREMYGYNHPYNVSPTIEHKSLHVEITTEQFEAIRKAVLTNF